ncbi:MAG: hypothetical protein IJM29_03870 [Bacteroidales bacterium]|nr:hypothetical protein [Bacteroidales bacterium]
MKRLAFLLGIALVISACGKIMGASAPEAKEISFIPGECLRGTILTPNTFDAPSIIGEPLSLDKEPFTIADNALIRSISLCPKSLCFSLEMDLDREREFMSFKAADYRFYPSYDVYEAFGSSSNTVEKEYEVFYDNITKSSDWVGQSIRLSSIYYCGGLVITASEDFAGIPAGENLASIAYVYTEDSYYHLPILEVPDNYMPLSSGGAYVYIPMGEYNLVKDVVKFHIEIPVKVGLFLNYLNDKRTDPNATMQFRDEVLTCEFTMGRGLR